MEIATSNSVDAQWWNVWFENCPASATSRAKAEALRTPRPSANATIHVSEATPSHRHPLQSPPTVPPSPSLANRSEALAPPTTFVPTTPLQTYPQATMTTPPRGGQFYVDVRAVDSVLKFGIPHEYRTRIWPALVELESYQTKVCAERQPPRLAPPPFATPQQQQQPLAADNQISASGYYHKLLAECNGEHPIWSRVIRLDLDRTFASHKYA